MILANVFWHIIQFLSSHYQIRVKVEGEEAVTPTTFAETVGNSIACR